MNAREIECTCSRVSPDSWHGHNELCPQFRVSRTESECGKPAEVVYVWPTMKTLPLCADHAEKARSVAAAMGFTLGQMPADVGVTCSQKVGR